MVIPMRITQEMIQIMKGVNGRAPVCELILVKTTIPRMMSAMVNPRGILIDNLISFILVSFCGSFLVNPFPTSIQPIERPSFKTASAATEKVRASTPGNPRYFRQVLDFDLAHQDVLFLFVPQQ